ncbi:MAG TPA: 1-acyl-sn-glycerol-3-phosphate acyltransferase [Chitinophagales bacterium]|nr:1-acyl-sn-glycerol-3-phosphate acyltransferase [Chitinophagales bacterium]
MKSLISYFLLLSIKYFSRLFYRFEIGWPEKRIKWGKIRLLIFLNHTSLFEFLYLGILPNHFLRKLSKRMVAPAANKTLDRPIVGTFFKMFSPGMISITRKRDDSWENFLESIYEDSIILIAPEGRMKRKNGLDLEGNKMTVKPGVVDIINGLQSGEMAIAYSGGLHHVQIPDEGLPKLFKTIKMNIELFDIPTYKAMFNAEIGSNIWRQLVLNDLQMRLETKVPG